jgi:hypothetical protein
MTSFSELILSELMFSEHKFTQLILSEHKFRPSFGSMYKGRANILRRAGAGLGWAATASGSVICPDLN